MIPQPGQIIFVYFNNGVQIEGRVVSWSDNKSVLKSSQGTSTIVIQKTLQDVMFFRFSNAETEYEKLKDKPRKDQDDIETLAELKNELNELERAETREKMNTHTPDSIRKVNYGNPFFKKGIESMFKKQ